MKVKLGFKVVVVSAAAALLFAANAKAQLGGAVRVSDTVEPGTGGSPLGGSSVARCGNNVVVGFSDTESGNQFSFAGYATSTDGGKSFVDRGVLPSAPAKTPQGPDVLGYGGAGEDGSVACGSASTFYYASVLRTWNPPCTDSINGCTAIALSLSVNGGASWSLPAVIGAASAGSNEDTSPSVAVDPTNPRRVYVAYVISDTLDPASSQYPFCTNTSEVVELFLAASADSGKTWSSKLVDHACADMTTNPEELGVLVGPKVAVSPGGKVYLVYQFMGSNGGLPQPNEIRFTRSVDDGQTFSAPVLVSREAIFKALPAIAVDRTLTRNRGSIYLSWSGSPIGTYTDILVSESTNFGASFSFPRSISAAPAVGSGRYQAKPVLAVDNDGQVAACFYETPTNSPSDSSTFSYNCGVSANHGASWSLQKVSSPAVASYSTGPGLPTFFGYDSLTSDFLLGNDGFFTAFEVQTNGQTHVVGVTADNP
jgi:hypothetical protein